MNVTPGHVPYKDFPIDTMPGLCARLSKARVERIRYHSYVTHPRPPSPRNTPNPLLQYMQRQVPFVGSAVDDIIEGVARLDHHSRKNGPSVPLSVTRLYNILQCMPVISTQEIRYMLGVDTRQAQKYLKAVKLCLFHIQRHIDTKKHPDSPADSLE